MTLTTVKTKLVKLGKFVEFILNFRVHCFFAVGQPKFVLAALLVEVIVHRRGEGDHLSFDECLNFLVVVQVLLRY